MQGLCHHIEPHSCVSSPYTCMYNAGLKGVNCLSILSGDYFVIFTKVQHSSSNFITSHSGCSLSNCQKISHPDVYPRCCQGIYLTLLYHVHNVAHHGGSQNHGDLGHKVGEIWDYQGYLILIIALDSIYLNPYDDIAHRSGKHIP